MSERVRVYDLRMWKRLNTTLAVIAIGAVGALVGQHDFAAPLYGQTPAPNPDIKHIAFTSIHGGRGGTISGFSIERGVGFPSIIHARGNVEIKIGGFVLRADQADYDEDSGNIEAHGIVKVKPYQQLSNQADQQELN